MGYVFRVLLCLFCFGFHGILNAQIWEDTETWNQEWEAKYTKFVRFDWSKDVTSSPTGPDGRPNPFYGLRPDCADAVYLMRAQFAYLNKLPFVIANSMDSRGRVSNRMERWNHLPEDQRIREFFRYAFGNLLSTATLPRDSFLIPIDHSHFKPGTFGLAAPASHHSWTHKDISTTGGPVILMSTTGNARRATVTLLEKQNWYSPFFVFRQHNGYPNPALRAGYRAFRWPQHLGIPEHEVPGYSDEQYRIPVDALHPTIERKLAIVDEEPVERLKRFLDETCRGLQARVTAVEDGVNNLARTGNRCLNQIEHFEYSTPSRDERLFEDLQLLRQTYYRALTDRQRLPSDLASRLQSLFPMIQSDSRDEISAMRPATSVNDQLCPVTYAPGRSIDLIEARRRLFLGLFSNSPHDPLEMRWGEVRGPSALARRCPSFGETWSPSINGL